MARAQVDQLVWLLGQAFEGGFEHALLSNLRHVDEDLANRKLAEGGRSIHEMVRHVAYFKFVYKSHAFGDGSEPQVPASGLGGGQPSLARLIEWAREGHRLLLTSVSALNDDDLERPRRVHWGDLMPTRRIVTTMIEHDLYHAGEINHLRALLQGDDRWGLGRGAQGGASAPPPG